MATIDLSTIRTCDDANLALADVLEVMENFDEAVEAAFTFAAEISHIRCAEGRDHRAISSVLPVIGQLLKAEERTTPKEFAGTLRTAVHEHRRAVNEAKASLTGFINMINQGRGPS